MPCMRHGFAGALALALLAGPCAAGAGTPADLYYERAVMSAAGARCGLFTPGLAAALEAAEYQARGAALRAGVADAVLQAASARAEAKARTVSCTSADLKTAGARVRLAFADYGKLLRMTFPGDIAGWKADRSLPRQGPVWRLSQTPSGGGALNFGLIGDWKAPYQLVVMSPLGPGDPPYAARLIMRDPARAPGPYLNVARLGSTARIPLAARVPPRSAAQVFTAEARLPASPELTPQGATAAEVFRFPAAAIAAMAALDPREAVTIEFLYMGGSRDSVRQAFVEVGDFAAGKAFLAAAG